MNFDTSLLRDRITGMARPPVVWESRPLKIMLEDETERRPKAAQFSFCVLAMPAACKRNIKVCRIRSSHMDIRVAK